MTSAERFGVFLKRGLCAPLFLCFTTYFRIFLPKNLHMSDKSSTFALEIGNGHV